MTKAVVIQIVAFALCLGAFLVSHLLYTAHRKANLPTWFRAGCGMDGGAASANCEEVITSPYGYWPPKHADSPPGRKHTPVALLGMTYYGLLAMWILGVGRPDRSRRWLHAFPLGVSVLGLAMSAWFMYLMFARLDYWCPWCTVTHVMNLLIFVCLVLLWPRASRVVAPGTPGTGDAPPATDSAPGVALPTMRQVAITLAGMFVLWLGVGVFDFAYGLGERAGERDACMAILEGFKNDGRRLVQHYDTMPRKDITLRPDDPTRGGKAGEPELPCVVFSDFECPACRSVATFLEERVAPLFDGNFKIIFKHFPLNAECNSAVRGTTHKHACRAAALAEAARLQGGDDAFWRAHDYLFEHRATLAQVTPDKLAEALGLDTEQLRTDSASDAVTQRIAEDVALATKLQLRSTPTVYVGGREVDMPGRGSVQFWDEIAGRYWQLRGVPRPEHTKVKPTAPATTAPPAGPNNHDHR